LRVGDESSIGETFARLLHEVDDGFAALEVSSDDAPSIRIESTEAELSEMRALFAQLASSHARPVRDLIIDLKAGEASQRWAELCRPSVKSLSLAAKKLAPSTGKSSSSFSPSTSGWRC
jgi:hypothetical protein